MQSAISAMSLLSNAVRAGRLNHRVGLRSAVQLALARRKRGADEDAKVVEVNVPGFPGRFCLRAGTVDISVFRQVILDTEYDIRPFPQFQKLEWLYSNEIREGRRPLIIDCGANIGLSAVWLSHTFPEAQVIAIEPAVDNIEIAKRNLAAYPNVVLIHGAIWDKATELKITDKGVEPCAYQVNESDIQAEACSQEKIKAFTIPELIKMAGASHPLIVKIDIEGAEASLFRSNIEWVRSTNLIMIELHDWMLPNQRTSAPFIRSFANLEFDFMQRGENTFIFIDI